MPFAYDPNAPEPTAWLDFLASVWDDDKDSIALLQEYFGYVLSGRLDMQKLLMLVGPTRSGKGTIARVLTALMGGRHNVPGPTLASMNTNFGLSPLIGKPLAIIADARLGNSALTVVERLLSITGEDTLTVDRKYREPWTGKLPTRFVILTNELPKFKDASGVIANQFLILRMTESFLGREDHGLAGELRAELAEILDWSLQGLDRLNRNGRFTVPASSQDVATADGRPGVAGVGVRPRQLRPRTRGDRHRERSLRRVAVLGRAERPSTRVEDHLRPRPTRSGTRVARQPTVDRRQEGAHLHPSRTPKAVLAMDLNKQCRFILCILCRMMNPQVNGHFCLHRMRHRMRRLSFRQTGRSTVRAQDAQDETAL